MTFDIDKKKKSIEKCGTMVIKPMIIQDRNFHLFLTKSESRPSSSNK